MFKALAIVVLAAAATFSVATLIDRDHEPRGVSAETATSAEIRESRREPAPGFAARKELVNGLKQPAAVKAPALSDAEVAAYRIPPVEPAPLQSLIVNAKSVGVQQRAEELRNWLKITSEMAVTSCWSQRRLRLPVWVEMAAALSVRDRETLAIDKLELVKIHGDYQLNDDEADCFRSSLAAITAKTGLASTVRALLDFFPLEEHFVFQYPCLSCRANRL